MTRDLEPGRLRRALTLRVERVAGGFAVTGGREPHRVTARDGRLSCDCRDGEFRPGMLCKHVAAVHFRVRLGSELFDALQAAVTEVAT